MTGSGCTGPWRTADGERQTAAELASRTGTDARYVAEWLAGQAAGGYLAGGNTSREVGAALFISPRTVEMHVQGCLLKLGCRTRAEAVRKLTELGALAS